jgi:hypothetical protein
MFDKTKDKIFQPVKNVALIAYAAIALAFAAFLVAVSR